MKEKIVINNFGGINSASIELNSINIFIGKQASGKSITAKLLYFFKGVFREIFDGAKEELTKVEIDKKLLAKFEEYFPSEGWNAKNFKIEYFIGEDSVSIERKTKTKLKIEYSEKIKKVFSLTRRFIKKDRERNQKADKFEIYRPSIQISEKYFSSIKKDFCEVSSNTQIFIPAGRSFFANLQSSIFSFLSNNKAIDPFLVEFGSFYESIKPFAERSSRLSPRNKKATDDLDRLIFEILGSKYLRDKKKDYLVHEDKRKINVSFSSSGQQETLPLILIFKALTRIGFLGGGATLYVEEPEAHLFPTAQKKIVELIATVYNISRERHQFIITTHSPYILTSFNNLLQAGQLDSMVETNKEQLYSIVPKHEILKPKEFNAFAMKNGNVENLMDEEMQIILSSILDEVSEEISLQFDNLLDL